MKEDTKSQLTGFASGGIFLVVALAAILPMMPPDPMHGSFSPWLAFICLMCTGALGAVIAFLVRERLPSKAVIPIGILAWVIVIATVLIKVHFS